MQPLMFEPKRAEAPISSWHWPHAHLHLRWGQRRSPQGICAQGWSAGEWTALGWDGTWPYIWHTVSVENKKYGTAKRGVNQTNKSKRLRKSDEEKRFILETTRKSISFGKTNKRQMWEKTQEVNKTCYCSLPLFWHTVSGSSLNCVFIT